MKNLIAILFAFGLAAQTPPMIPMATGGGPVGGATNLTTVGSVPYVSASGTLDQDAGQFVWDATNNRLGIGTTAPNGPLDVRLAAAGNIISFVTAADGGNGAYFGIDTTLKAAYWRLNTAATYGFQLQGPSGGTKFATFWGTTRNMSLGSAADANFRFDVSESGSSGTARFYDQTALTGSTLAVIRAGVNQSTDDLLKIQNNAGTDLVKVSSTGAATVSSLVVGNTASITGSSNTITLSGALTLAGANNQIVFNNQANSANYWIISAGALYAGSAGTSFTSPLYQSTTNCSSSAGPAVCAAAAAGSVVIPAAGTDVTVNTTAVTANSQIFAIFDQSLGTKLGVTCNSTTANPHIGARVAGTSFTIHANVSPVTNPACFSYFIIN